MATWGGGEEQAAAHRLRVLARQHDVLLSRTVAAIRAAERAGHITAGQAAGLTGDVEASRDAAVKLLDGIWPGTGR